MLLIKQLNRVYLIWKKVRKSKKWNQIYSSRFENWISIVIVIDWKSHFITNFTGFKMALIQKFNQVGFILKSTDEINFTQMVFNSTWFKNRTLI